jgi:hypothetical protein
MIGTNPLWVSKQHGHSVTTMLRVYTAWAEGAIEADIEAIKSAMKRRPGKLLVVLKPQGERQRGGTSPYRNNYRPNHEDGPPEKQDKYCA